MKYLIFLDIDGTILTSDGKISPRNVSAIKKAQEQGHMVFINTGRSVNVIPKEVLEGVNPSGIVAGLGAWISVGDEVLLSEAISKENIMLSMEVADKFDNRVLLEGEKNSVSYHGLSFLGEDFEIKTPEELYERYPDIRISKMTYEKTLTPEATKILEPHFEVFNHPTYSEIGLPGCNKAKGMDFLRERFGVDKDHVIAMGDSENDRLMLEAAGIAVVMGDGHPNVKKIADFVSIDCADGGVGYAIEQLVLNKD